MSANTIRMGVEDVFVPGAMDVLAPRFGGLAGHAAATAFGPGVIEPVALDGPDLEVLEALTTTPAETKAYLQLEKAALEAILELGSRDGFREAPFTSAPRHTTPAYGYGAQISSSGRVGQPPYVAQFSVDVTHGHVTSRDLANPYNRSLLLHGERDVAASISTAVLGFTMREEENPSQRHGDTVWSLGDWHTWHHSSAAYQAQIEAGTRNVNGTRVLDMFRVANRLAYLLPIKPAIKQ